MCQRCQIFNCFFLKLPYLNNSFQQVVKTFQDLLLKKLLYSLTYSQSWLIPHVEDLLMWLNQKIEKKEKKENPGFNVGK